MLIVDDMLYRRVCGWSKKGDGHMRAGKYACSAIIGFWAFCTLVHCPTARADERPAVPDDTAWYTVEGTDDNPDLFGPETHITVSATGDQIPAFTVQVDGVGDMVTDFGHELLLEDGAPKIINWDVQNDGATIELAVLSAGSLVIPQALVEAFPPAGGMGLFPWLGFIRRVKRKVVESPFGPVEVTAVSEKTFQAVHNPW